MGLQYRRSCKTRLVAVRASEEGEYAVSVLTAHGSIPDLIRTTTTPHI